MAGVIDSTTGNIELRGDGVGWSRCSVPLPAAAAGVDRMLMLLRFWIDSTVDISNSGLTWDDGAYFGLSFTGTHMDNITSGGDYNTPPDGNFFGSVATPSSPGSDLGSIYYDTNASYDGFAEMKGGSSNAGPGVYNGNNSLNSGVHESAGLSMSNSFMQAFGIPAGEDFGKLVTIAWMFYSNEGNNIVTSDCWANTDGVNLDTLDLNTGIDPSDPKLVLPVSDSRQRIKQVNADDFGSNWRPTDGGDVDFPTHFLARFPFITNKMVIDYLGVQYSQNGIVS